MSGRAGITVAGRKDTMSRTESTFSAGGEDDETNGKLDSTNCTYLDT